MLNIIMSDSVKSSMIRLADMVKALIKAHQMDADIKLLTLNQRNILQAPVEKNDACLFILEFHMENIALYQKISGLYSDSSILFFSGTIDAIVLKAALSGNIRPSGFIEKPVNIRELQEAFMDVYASYINRLPGQEEVVHAPVGGRIYRVPLKSIIYFETLGKKINLVTKSRCISYYDSLYNLENAHSDFFIRCHKSFLVNMQRIQEAMFNEMTLVMDNEDKVPISRTYKNSVKEALHLMPKNMRLVSKS